MKIFKYFGDSPNPELKRVHTNLPVDEQDFRNNQLQIFRDVFRDQITKAHKGSDLYSTVKPQQNAFDELYALIEENNYKLIEITSNLNTDNSFVVRVQIGIPTVPRFHEQLFKTKKPIPDNSEGLVLVSFYLGLCPDYVLLSDRNELVEKALSEIPTDTPAKVKDLAFCPFIVIPGILKRLELKQRFKTINSNDEYFFQSSKGYFYQIEIDGFNVVTP